MAKEHAIKQFKNHIFYTYQFGLKRSPYRSLVRAEIVLFVIYEAWVILNDSFGLILDIISATAFASLDLKDVFNYRKRLQTKNQDVYIFIWVKWEAHKMVTSYKSYSVNKMGGIWVTKISKLLNHLKRNYVGIHWYKEKFRQPNFFEQDNPWAKELIKFERRLLINEKVKNISSNGFARIGIDNITYPSGHSSCSYVFNLKEQTIFENLYLKL